MTEELFVAPKSDAEVVGSIREKYQAMARDLDHREYKMALDLLVKSLGLVLDDLETVADVEADLKKRAEKAKLVK